MSSQDYAPRPRGTLGRGTCGLSRCPSRRPACARPFNLKRAAFLPISVNTLKYETSVPGEIPGRRGADYTPEVRKTMSKLIVLEGLDGAGKGTQTKILADRLTAEGRRVRTLEFPDYASDGSMLVRMYLSGRFGENPDDTGPYAASVFFAADRYASYASDWKKDAQREDTVILANRYTTANAYHQLSKLPREDWDGFLDWLWDFEFVKLGLPRPDLVLLLDMPERVSSALVRKRSAETGAKTDIHERDGDYLRRSREAAAYAARREGWRVIRCAGEDADMPDPPEVIGERVYRAVRDVL